MKYVAIADELRARIARGELPPGARVPSTRRLAADHGVALATAAKALDLLSQEGVVRAEPRSGTVVADRDRRGGQRGLTREQLVRTAITIADTEGLGALSMRGVAARLGVAAMAPYRYVRGKDELVLLMADAAFGERGYPAEPSGDWRERLLLGGRTLWSLFKRHPWLAQLGPITRPLPLRNLAVHGEWTLAALSELGVDAATLCNLHVLVFGHVQGMAVHLEREQSALASSGLTEDDWMDHQGPAVAAMAAGHPTFARMLADLTETGYDLVLDDIFDLGMRALLDGLALRFGR
ncbi:MULTISPECIES: GntR family transcriptional regulator [unclassified Amycolatopsis]|uniref:GntR family transcriptional regulator n=1 Tax=unclassified Amycolatopsis TaxID=2618356 RepID=UPI002874B302|nr:MULTISPECIES: GntR family transcriptional regulator [unclassified Amycolatopsis]MDS0133754.1 GntR family transcriptional regulator [Amycolatopsis sp. 505]MDS0144630.1 GntR family transcriptional regulator [Amycolatopsis sp. CM201R]